MADDSMQAYDQRLGGTVQRYLSGNETLRCTAFNSAANVRVRMAGRTFTRAGGVNEFSDAFTPTSDRIATVLDKPLNEGWLLSVAIRIDAGAPLDGQTYVRVELGAGRAGQFTPLDVLTADTLTAAHLVGWPGSPIRGPLEGPGALRAITGTNPGVGNEISETVPTGARWELFGFFTNLSSSAGVVNRRPQLYIDDGTNRVYQVSANNTQAQSLVYSYAFAQGASQVADTTNLAVTSPLPVGMRLGAGYRIRTVTTNIQGADFYTAVAYLVREWIEGA